MMDFSDLYSMMQIESRRKQLFDLDHFVQTLTSYEEYSFAERMQQKFIDLELQALTERFQNLSRDERMLKLADNKLPAIDDTHHIGDEEEITSKHKYCDMDLIILDDDEGHDTSFINLTEGNEPEGVEGKEDEDENQDDDEGGVSPPPADDDKRDDDDDNQGGAGNALVLNGQADKSVADEPTENVQQPPSESTPPQNPTSQQDPSPADEPVQKTVVDKGKRPIDNVVIYTVPSDDEQLKHAMKVSLYENKTGLDYGQNSQGLIPILQIRVSQPVHTTAIPPVTAEKHTEDMVTAEQTIVTPVTANLQTEEPVPASVQTVAAELNAPTPVTAEMHTVEVPVTASKQTERKTAEQAADKRMVADLDQVDNAEKAYTTDDISTSDEDKEDTEDDTPLKADFTPADDRFVNQVIRNTSIPSDPMPTI